jgi:hypothetical protein
MDNRDLIKPTEILVYSNRFADLNYNKNYTLSFQQDLEVRQLKTDENLILSTRDTLLIRHIFNDIICKSKFQYVGKTYHRPNLIFDIEMENSTTVSFELFSFNQNELNPSSVWLVFGKFVLCDEGNKILNSLRKSHPNFDLTNYNSFIKACKPNPIN